MWRLNLFILLQPWHAKHLPGTIHVFGICLTLPLCKHRSKHDETNRSHRDYSLPGAWAEANAGTHADPLYKYAKVLVCLCTSCTFFSACCFPAAEAFFSHFRLRGKQGDLRYSTTHCGDRGRAPWRCSEHSKSLSLPDFSGGCVPPR